MYMVIVVCWVIIVVIVCNMHSGSSVHSLCIVFTPSYDHMEHTLFSVHCVYNMQSVCVWRVQFVYWPYCVWSAKWSSCLWCAMCIVCMVVNSIYTVLTPSFDHLHTGHSVVRVRIVLTSSYDHFQHCTSTSLAITTHSGTLYHFISRWVDDQIIFCRFAVFSNDHS